MAPRISVLFVLDRKYISVKDVFFETPLTEDITSKEFFFFKGGYDTVFSKRWWRTQYGKDAPKYIGEYVKKMKMALLTN